MRILRLTMFKNPDEHTGMIVRASDITVPFDEMRRQMMMPDFLVLAEEFEMPDGVSIEQATAEAVGRQRRRAKTEHDLAIMYFWGTRHLLDRVLAPGRAGWSATSPAPYTADDVVPVFEQIAAYSNYRGQLMRTATSDGWIVVLSNGRIARERMPFGGRGGMVNG